MAKKPDTPCAGCGKLLWSGGSSLPPGQRRCQDCRRSDSPRPRPAAQATPTPGYCTNCGKPTGTRERRTCSDTCVKARRAANVIRINAAPKPLGKCDDCGTLTSRGATAAGRCCVECAKARKLARYIRKNHKRRAPQRLTDITTEYERTLRKTTRCCPMCKVRMTDRPGQPNSKHLDHIIPLVIGGTHTVGNVRIICRTCNLGRPKDGSDLAGHQPTLWAQDLAAVPFAVRAPRPRPRCGDCGQTLRAGRCWTCRPSRARHRIAPEVGRLAASMRASGLAWQEISDELGLGGPGSAYQVARRDGAAADVAAWPTRGSRQAA